MGWMGAAWHWRGSIWAGWGHPDTGRAGHRLDGGTLARIRVVAGLRIRIGVGLRLKQSQALSPH